MKRMLINATQIEELRIAFVNKQKLYDLKIENIKNKSKKLNIYKGKIIKIEPSLNAVFVDYGSFKYGFLPLKEISKEYLKKNNKNINNILYIGKEILVQINKEERENKCALLTTFICLIGNFLILMPNNPKIKGVSKKIEKNERLKIKKNISLLGIPKKMGFIIRTLGSGKSIKTLKNDLYIKLKNWEYIKNKFKKKKNPGVLYHENNIFLNIFRDSIIKDIDEILIDNIKIYKIIKKLKNNNYKNKIKFYKGNISLFNYFKIESQIESAFIRKVRLPSGGCIIIDNTEALTSIDINSSKSTKSKNIENTAFNTNLEATEEISRQLRLRDISGLIVIDFIDMYTEKNKKIIEKNLKEKTKNDRAKIKIGYISKFGLLEMSRQRLNPSLKESNYYKCPRCKGNRIIRNYKSLSLSILRIIEEKSLKKNTNIIYAIVPINIASYLLNKKRKNLYIIEKNIKPKIKIYIIPNKKIKNPNFFIIRKKKGEKYNKFNLLKKKNK